MAKWSSSSPTNSSTCRESNPRSAISSLSSVGSIGPRLTRRTIAIVPTSNRSVTVVTAAEVGPAASDPDDRGSFKCFESNTSIMPLTREWALRHPGWPAYS